jgi:hypothetical protein
VLLYAFYDCQPHSRMKTREGSIVSVDGDVAMLVNVRSALRLNNVGSKTKWWRG